RPDRQNNRKTALDEAFCDYWAASQLGTPHIWAWHRRHDDQEIHPRSLASGKTMNDFDPSPGADPHPNGTIWASAFWDLRAMLIGNRRDGERRADLLALKTLIELGRITDPNGEHTVSSVRRARESFSVALWVLLKADDLLNDGSNRQLILSAFGARGILPEPI